MTDGGAAPVGPDTHWRLLAEFVVPGGAGSVARAAALAAEAVRHLDLPPAQLRIVRKTVADAARRVEASDDTGDPSLPIFVSVHISHGEAQAAAASRGWGCFVVKRLADETPAAGLGPNHKIELFLYSEGLRPIP